MDVSAKTGQNIKEFFRELAFVIAGGGKKAKEDVSQSKITANSNPITSQSAKPVSNAMKLTS